ncbi:MAG: Rpn family recombination-promoting nuclease/putative transposase [Bacteroides sp.]
MERFINPFSDYGFKVIFGREDSKPLLISFLNSLLTSEKEICDLTYINPALLPEMETGRGTIYDVLCTTADGEQIIVEMQYKEQAYFKERALYYLSRAIANQGERGSSWQFKVKAVYGVFFMNFCLEGAGKFRTDVILADRDTGALFSDKLRQVFLALPLFTKKESECASFFDCWIYTLKNMEYLKDLPFQPYMAVFKQLEQITDIASLTKEERLNYDESIKIYRDNLAVIDFAEKKARQEGVAEGEARGEIKGKLFTASNLKAAGVSIELIAQVTGLSVDEIRNCK